MKNLLLVIAILGGYVFAHTTLVVPVNFEDKPTQPFTWEHLAGQIGLTEAFYTENSGGQFIIQPTITDWVTVPMAYSVCDLARFVDLVNAQVDTSGYEFVVYAHVGNGCGFAGRGYPMGIAFINSDRPSHLVITHEFGHMLNLRHSMGWRNGLVDYGDVFDVMGPGTPYHLNLFQKERLGWAAAVEITESGFYTLQPYQASRTGYKLRSGENWYYIEKREAFGVDVPLAQYFTGPHVRIIQPYYSTTIPALLDMTPETLSFYDSAMSVGQTYSDGTINITAISDREVYVTVPPLAPVCVKENKRGKCLRWQ